MFRTCKYCHKVVKEEHKCNKKPVYKKHNEKLIRFRNSKEWKHKALEIKERDKYLCKWCFHKNRYVYNRLSVHHIIGLEENFELRLEDSNLITLCRDCHEEAEKGNIKKEELQKLIPPT